MMPDSVSLSIAPTAGNSLFASNQGASAPAGLFDLLVALLGGSGQPDMLSQLVGGKNLPVLDATQLQKLQDMLGSDTAQLPDLSTLLSQLQTSGEGDGPLATFLRKLTTELDGGLLSEDDLKAAFADLDENEQQDVLADVQSLLMPAPPPAPLPVAAPLPVEDNTDIEPAKPVLADATPAPIQRPEDAIGHAPVPAPADKQATPPTVPGPAPTPEKPQPQQKAEAADLAAQNAATAAAATDEAQAAQDTKAAARAETSLALREIAKALKEAAATQTQTEIPESARGQIAEVKPKDVVPVAAPPAPVAPRPDVVVAPDATEMAKSAPVAALAGDSNPLLKAVANALKTDGEGAAPAVTPEANAPTPAPASGPHNSTQNSSFANELKAIQQTHGTPHTPITQQIGVQLHKAAADGQDRITIRLQPPELGRIDVKLEVDSAGRVTAHISADNPVTLDLMKRDQSGLERALTDAGLKTDSGSLNFQSRQDGQQAFANQNQNDRGPQGNNQNVPGFWDDNGEDAAAAAATLEMTWYATPDRVDVRI